ncbi:MAG TPA: gas vesicle protein [Longimicrobiales bacterium]|nr:gas vesicle protein [Longimicrobiales bacterium]
MSAKPGEPPPPERSRAKELELQEQLVLSELLNRVLDKGVVVSGEVLISVAGVDLIYLGLDLLLTSVESARERRPHGRSL